jgi:glycosyltransferase involved in cell wall biosynthesis
VYYIIDELYRLVPQKSFRGLAWLIESSNLRKADLVLTINEGLREYCQSRGSVKDRTKVVRAGVELGRFNQTNERREVRRRFGVSDDDILLFFMGWLYNFSGLDSLVQSMSAMRGDYDNIKLLVVGRGEQWDELCRLRVKNKLEDRFILLDWQPYDRVPGLVAAADICVLPSKKNPLMESIVPIKMYEYMAAGKPVISTGFHGIRLEFGSSNGVIYADGPEDVLKKVVELVDESRIDEEGTKAKNFVKHSDWSTVTDEFEMILKALK